MTASGLHSAPRARRIAKEVAIDYIRKYLDGDYERYEVSLDHDLSYAPIDEHEIVQLNSSGGSITTSVVPASSSALNHSGRLSRSLSRRLSITANSGAEIARMPVVRTRSGMMVEAAPVSSDFGWLIM